MVFSVKGRRANLYGLINKAIEFENSSFRGLFQFIRFIDELIDRGRDFGEENIVGPNDNVVRMMTIHSSKVWNSHSSSILAFLRNIMKAI